MNTPQLMVGSAALDTGLLASTLLLVRQDGRIGRREPGGGKLAQALPYKLATAWRAPRIRCAVMSGCWPNS